MNKIILSVLLIISLQSFGQIPGTLKYKPVIKYYSIETDTAKIRLTELIIKESEKNSERILMIRRDTIYCWNPKINRWEKVNNYKHILCTTQKKQ